MTDGEKQAYNFLKKCNEKDLENFDYFSEPSKLQIKYMETVLNLIVKQQAEIENLKNRKERQLKRFSKYKENIENKHEEIYEDLVQEIEKKDKIIDKMAQFIWEEDTIFRLPDDVTTPEEVRKYFEKETEV